MLSLRRAGQEDAAAIARIFTPARQSMPGVPDIHSAREDAAFIANTLLPSRVVWAAVLEGEIVGMATWHSGWLTHLYVDPARHRQGIGAALLNSAKTDNPDGLQLWVFQSNVPARAFYERHGFACAETTDGQDNEEKSPDARYVWTQDKGAASC